MAHRFLLLATAVVAAENLTGQNSIIDGDTLKMHGARIRLWGIDAAESSQLCRGDDSLQYRCGAKAASELDRFINGRAVSCVPVALDRYGRTVASCAVGVLTLASGWSAAASRWIGRSTPTLNMPVLDARPSGPNEGCLQAVISHLGSIVVALGEGVAERLFGRREFNP